MTTTDLLRDVLRTHADAAATPDGVAAARTRLLASTAAPATTADPVVITDAAGRRPRRRRPVAVAVGALAAVVVAALVVVGFVADRPGPGGTTPSATAPANALPLTEYGFTVRADPGGVPFAYGGTADGVQGGVWRASAATPAAASLNVLTGSGETPVPTRPVDATPLAGDAGTGWTARVGPVGPDLYFGIDPADTLTVWRDDVTGLWAALLTSGLDAGRVRALAATVHLGDYHAVRSPVRLETLPTTSTLTAVSASSQALDLVFGPHGDDFSLAIDPAGSAGGTGASYGGVVPHAPLQPIDAGGFHGSYRADDPITIVSDGVVDVSVSYGAGSTFPANGVTRAMPLGQLTSLLGGLSVADLSDPSTWTDLASALPHS